MGSLVGATALLLSVGVLAGAVRSERTPQAREIVAVAQSRIDAPGVELAKPAVARSRVAVWRQYGWPHSWQPPGPPQSRQTPRYDHRFAYRDDTWRNNTGRNNTGRDDTWRDNTWRAWPNWRGPYDYGTRQSQRPYRQDRYGWRPNNRPNSRQDNDQGWHQGWRAPPRLRPRSDDHRWVGTPLNSNRMW